MQKPPDTALADLAPPSDEASHDMGNHDMGSLARLGLWGAAAAAGLLLVAIVAYTDAGQHRLGLLFQGQGGTPAATIAVLDERRGFAEEARDLAQDRERRIARMTAPERSDEDVTGSTGRPAKPPAGEAAPQVGQFAVDLGGASSLSALRTAWERLRAEHSDRLEGLRPVVSVREGRGGKIELRLVIGPLDDPVRAAKLCAALAPTGLSCEPAIFDGQRLALR